MIIVSTSSVEIKAGILSGLTMGILVCLLGIFSFVFIIHWPWAMGPSDVTRTVIFWFLLPLASCVILGLVVGVILSFAQDKLRAKKIVKILIVCLPTVGLAGHFASTHLMGFPFSIENYLFVHFFPSVTLAALWAFLLNNFLTRDIKKVTHFLGILVIVITIVLGIFVTLVYMFPPPPTPSMFECKAMFINWCTGCAMNGWSDQEIPKELEECLKYYSDIGVKVIDDGRCNQYNTSYGCFVVGVTG